MVKGNTETVKSPQRNRGKATDLIKISEYGETILEIEEKDQPKTLPKV